MKYYKYYILSFGIIILDQVVKLLIHFNMDLGPAGTIPIFGDWFKLLYTLNPGMAFGLEVGTNYGKLFLTLFRLVAMIAIAIYLLKLAKRQVHPGLLWCGALILGGAVGNVIDSTFYGVFLDNAPYNAPIRWFHGQVIDMFYVDIWEGWVWIPFYGDFHLSLWPIFNIADASIFVAVVVILTMQKKFLKGGFMEEWEEGNEEGYKGNKGIRK
ncbi:MAG: lipoprotein signal peptidase [Cytophagales bacterium]|nr:lipoprotein signal peptidase [Cytophagales bacterium]